MRLCANISTMFNYLDMIDRFNEASAEGFQACEVQCPYELPKEELRKSMDAAEIPLVLMNSHKDFYNNEMIVDPTMAGMACNHRKVSSFYNSIQDAAFYCDYLKCPKLHILAGNLPEDVPMAMVEQTYRENLTFAAKTLKKYNVVAVIEPICPQVLPNYFLNSFEMAIKFISEIKKKNLKLLLDIYHLHNIEGNVDRLAEYLPYAGHIQMSQSPNRNEPLSDGEIDYENVFQTLVENNYTGDVGLEYTPTGDNPDFKWIANYDRCFKVNV